MTSKYRSPAVGVDDVSLDVHLGSLMAVIGLTDGVTQGLTVGEVVGYPVSAVVGVALELRQKNYMTPSTRQIALCFLVVAEIQ